MKSNDAVVIPKDRLEKILAFAKKKKPATDDNEVEPIVQQKNSSLKNRYSKIPKITSPKRCKSKKSNIPRLKKTPACSHKKEIDEEKNVFPQETVFSASEKAETSNEVDEIRERALRIRERTEALRERRRNEIITAQEEIETKRANQIDSYKQTMSRLYYDSMNS